MKSDAIGIFDSGMGGLSVLAQAKKLLPNEKYIYYGDSKNAPYGIKSKEEVIRLSIEICDYFANRNVKAIIVACNTATSAAVKVLRLKYDIPIIGMEPALKPAIENNQGGHIAVMATPMTLREEKFNKLLERIETSTKIYKVPAPKVVELVEQGITVGGQVDKVVEEYFLGIKLSTIESVVLGCTHFVFIKSSISKVLNKKIQFYDGNYGTIMQLKRRLEKNNLLCEDKLECDVEIINTGGKKYLEVSKKLLESI